MREILFRGKDIISGEWVTGFLVDGRHIGSWLECEPVNPDTVGQFIGMTDKNGNPIFEGDVLCRGDVKGHVLYSDESCRFLFRWKRFDIYRPDHFKNCGLSDYAFLRDLEVIGNIHDNPELLEGV